jgi:hypothetical protein
MHDKYFELPKQAHTPLDLKTALFSSVFSDIRHRSYIERSNDLSADIFDMLDLHPCLLYVFPEGCIYPISEQLSFSHQKYKINV